MFPFREQKKRKEHYTRSRVIEQHSGCCVHERKQRLKPPLSVQHKSSSVNHTVHTHCTHTLHTHTVHTHRTHTVHTHCVALQWFSTKFIRLRSTITPLFLNVGNIFNAHVSLLLTFPLAFFLLPPSTNIIICLETVNRQKWFIHVSKRLLIHKPSGICCQGPRGSPSRASCLCNRSLW